MKNLKLTVEAAVVENPTIPVLLGTDVPELFQLLDRHPETCGTSKAQVFASHWICYKNLHCHMIAFYTLKLWPPAVNEHTWDAVRSLISAFNTRMQNVKPGTEVVVDESMGKWIPMFEGTPEGVPHLKKIIRKPCGVGIEYKDVADVNTGIILFLEIQEGVDHMASKKYCYSILSMWL